jgi:hypothetical protein
MQRLIHVSRELEHHLVPEWRAKYLDYKVGKKKIKAVQRALRNAQSSTPRTPLRRGNAPLYTPENVAPQYSYLNRETQNLHDASQRPPSQGQEPAIPPPATAPSPSPSPVMTRDFARTPSNKGGITNNTTASSGYLTPLHRARSRPTPSNSTEALETSPLISHNDHRPASSDPANATYSDNNSNNTRGLTRYGSIIGSPPRDSSRSLRGRGPPSLDLPGPALRTQSQKSSSNLRLEVSSDDVGKSERKKRKDGKKSPSPGATGRKNTITHRTPLSMRHRSIFHPIRINSSPHINASSGTHRPLVKRLFSLGAVNTPQPGEFPMAAYKDVDVRQGEFFNFLDLELEKVEDFYKSKEDDATKRLDVLRQQLHIMRDRRVEDILQARAHSVSLKHPHDGENGKDEGRNGSIVSKAVDKLDGAFERARQGNIGRRSKALETLTTGGPIMSNDDDETQENWNRDYVRKIKHSNVPYHTARRKLKLAIQEYYRGLELLKSYALLNQKAFRKINKKYDKAVNARPSLRYMNEKVNTAYFVTSDVVDGHIRMVEDLYARYFEGGNHKVAAGKLRAKTSKSADYTSVVFRNGLYLATGLVFAVEGLVYAGQIIEGSDDGLLRTNASFLLQVSQRHSHVCGKIALISCVRSMPATFSCSCSCYSSS